MTIIGKLLEEFKKIEQRLEISETVCYNESIEDELKEFGIDIDEFELQLLISEYTMPDNFKRYFTSEINNNLSNEEKKKKILVKYIGDWKVIFINNGFNNYKFIDVINIEEI